MPPGPAEVAPLHATPRTPGRPTHGGAIAAFARGLGSQLMPHQQLVADVATETLEDGSWAYDTVVLEVQRQAGKTHLVAPMAVERCATIRDALTWFTAQTRQDARDTFTEGYMKRLENAPLRSRVKARRSNGSEGLWFPTGSSFRVFAPTGAALHGKANHLVIVDEAWAFDGAHGLELEQAIFPTFSTTGGQTWIVSAAGHGESAWLRSWAERGRASVELGRRSGLAYFRWGLDPRLRPEVEEGLEAGKRDPDCAAFAHALQLVIDAHPAARRPGFPEGTVLPAVLRSSALKMPVGEFLRAYATVWTASEERVIPAASWAACEAETWPEPAIPVALGLDVALDRSDASLVAAWRDRPGAPMRWDVLERRPGPAGWVPEYVRDLVARRRVVGISHAGGPAADVADSLARELKRSRSTVEPVQLKAGEYVTACQGVLSAAIVGDLSHHGQPVLEAAVAAAAKRDHAGEGWAWSRRESAASIAPLVAATCAGWTFDHSAPPMPKPALVTTRRRLVASPS